MSWPFFLILAPTVCYGATAVAYAIRQDWPNVTIFTGYCIANCGFLAIELVKAK